MLKAPSRTVDASCKKSFKGRHRRCRSVSGELLWLRERTTDRTTMGPLFLGGPRRESATAAVDGVVKLNGRHLAWIPSHQMMLLSTRGAIKAFRQQSSCIHKTRGFYSFCISRRRRRVKTKCKKTQSVLHKICALDELLYVLKWEDGPKPLVALRTIIGTHSPSKQELPLN